LSEQLNLSKIQSHHTEDEWVALVCLLLSRLPKAFIVIETEALHKAYIHNPSWAQQFCGYLQTIVDRSSAAGNQLKLLLAMYGNGYQVGTDLTRPKNVLVTTLQPQTPIPPRLRHIARRSGLDAKGWMFRRVKLQTQS
jgi:hypothetical protein